MTIPSDVASGDYRLEVAGGLSVVSAPLSVAGSPIGTDEGEQPGQEEGLLVPFPSSFGQVGAGAMAGAGSSASPGLGGSPGVVAGALAATRAGRDPGEGLLVIGLAGLTAGLTAGALLLALRLRVRRTHGAA